MDRSLGSLLGWRRTHGVSLVGGRINRVALRDRQRTLSKTRVRSHAARSVRQVRQRGSYVVRSEQCNISCQPFLNYARNWLRMRQVARARGSDPPAEPAWVLVSARAPLVYCTIPDLLRHPGRISIALDPTRLLHRPLLHGPEMKK